MHAHGKWNWNAENYWKRQQNNFLLYVILYVILYILCAQWAHKDLKCDVLDLISFSFNYNDCHW